jgi:uncharacterized protein (TIGR03118 family)
MNQVSSVQSKFVPSIFNGAQAAAVLLCLSMFSTPARAQYQRTDLVSNQPAVAPLQDEHLVNAWGLVSTATSPYWVSDNGSGFSTLYTAAGTQVSLFVSVPPAPSSPEGTLGTPTGIVANISPNATDFTISGNGTSGRASFIFDTLDGTISAWNSKVAIVSGGVSHANLVADRSSVGAVYTGLAIAVDESNRAHLYAADNSQNRRVDIFDSSFNFLQSFSDPEIPSNFAPFGVQAINGQIWVTFSALNKAESGFVDVFDLSGNLVKHLAVSGPLHQPWGVALAPANFGPMSNAILISNNIAKGRIDAFNPETGEFMGSLSDTKGKPIEIDGLWAIQFGQGGASNGAKNELFYTAGPNNSANGLFGKITFE